MTLWYDCAMNTMPQIEYRTRAIEYVQTREQWLERAAAMKGEGLLSGLRGLRYRVSCGWPATSALARGKRRIGECWYPAHSTDGRTSNVFISPAIENPIAVLETLAHELIHVVAGPKAGPKAGHKGEFMTIAKAVGFKAPWTSTPATPELIGRLNGLLTSLGLYPHAAIDKSGRKKQGTRLLKVVCAACGYTIRTTQQWIDTGLPTCACGAEMELAN